MSSHFPKLRRGEPAYALLKIADIGALLRAQSGEVCISIPAGPESQTVYPLHSPGFRGWLQQRFFAEFGTAAPRDAIQSAIQTLEARILHNVTRAVPVGQRLLSHDGKVILDLADETQACVEISASGWQFGDRLLHCFERSPSVAALPAPPSPNPGGAAALETLRTLLNLPPGVSWNRALLWMHCALRAQGPFPILVLRGPSGSAKTTAAELLRTVLDPTLGSLHAFPGSPSQLAKLAAQQRVLAFDDVPRIPPQLANSLAKLADEKAPILLVISANSTAELPENIARRSLVVTLQTPQTLRTLRSIRKDFEHIHAPALGALCTATSAALSRIDAIPETNLVRLADATLWARAGRDSLRLSEADIAEAITSLPPNLDARALRAATRSTPNLALDPAVEPETQPIGDQTKLPREQIKPIHEQTKLPREQTLLSRDGNGAVPPLTRTSTRIAL